MVSLFEFARLCPHQFFPVVGNAIDYGFEQLFSMSFG